MNRSPHPNPHPTTCHWCHVMEHESFENDEIAGAAEPRLRLDQGRSRGAARRRSRLHVVRAGDDRIRRLADDRLPDAGAEAVLRRHLFPADSRWGRPGFSICSTELARVWKEDRRASIRRPAELFDRLKLVTGRRRGTARGDVDHRRRGRARRRASSSSRWRSIAAAAASATRRSFRGPSELLFLLREHARRTGGRVAQAPLLMVAETLRAMALGGMRDHIGGGFHRYSVDAEWRVPHFEKMLYDQAQLVLAYLEAAQATGDPFYATVAEDTLAYVLRDHDRPDGGFYSAEDADSIPARAGRRIRRRAQDGRRVLHLDRRGDRRARRDDSTSSRRAVRHRAGRQRAARSAGRVHAARTCSTSRSRSTTSSRAATEATTSRGARSARGSCCSPRGERRPRPHLDDKVLTAWNGLMIAAFARAARVLAGSPRTRPRISPPHERAAGFIRDTLWNAERAHAAAPLSRRRRRHRRVRRGLRAT